MAQGIMHTNTHTGRVGRGAVWVSDRFIITAIPFHLSPQLPSIQTIVHLENFILIKDSIFQSPIHFENIKKASKLVMFCRPKVSERTFLFSFDVP